MALRKKPVDIDDAPCKSCPYRKDVPSAIWAKFEYEKLREYDKPIGDQIILGNAGLFMCHSSPKKLCAGWVGCHGPNAAGLRLAAMDIGERVTAKVLDFVSPVPLFKSGTAAYRHGVRHLKNPKADARRAVGRLLRRRERDRG